MSIDENWLFGQQTMCEIGRNLYSKRFLDKWMRSLLAEEDKL